MQRSKFGTRCLHRTCPKCVGTSCGDGSSDVSFLSLCCVSCVCVMYFVISYDCCMPALIVTY